MGVTSRGGAVCCSYVSVSENQIKKKQLPLAALVLVRSLHCVISTAPLVHTSDDSVCMHFHLYSLCVFCARVFAHSHSPLQTLPYHPGTVTNLHCRAHLLMSRCVER